MAIDMIIRITEMISSINLDLRYFKVTVSIFQHIDPSILAPFKKFIKMSSTRTRQKIM